jgi:carboxyl-terminal processing protease
MRTRQLVFLFLAVFLLGVTVARLPHTLAALRTQDNWEKALAEVHDLIKDRYVKPVSDEDLYKGAIDGMVKVLDDRFSEFVPPADTASFEKELTGQFVGIGATIAMEDGVLTIVSPLEDSPALKAGLLPGDRVPLVDGKPTSGFASTLDAIKVLTGKPGTSVTLTIERDGKRSEVTIERGPIVARMTHGIRYAPEKGDWDYTLDATRGVAYIHLAQFTPTCADDLQRSIMAAGGSAKVKALVLDLRDNPGGALDQAEAIADMFLDSGVIVSTKGRAHREKIVEAIAGQELPGVPIAVLINGNSASASEILAGALVDNKRAIVIGTRSYGKGVVQSLEELDHLPGSLLKLTEQNYYLPSGRLIQRTPGATAWGVDPSEGFFVPISEGERRANFLIRRVIEGVRPAASPLPDGAAPRLNFADSEWIKRDFSDPQLAAALKALQIKLDSGQWVATGEPLPKDAASAGAASKELDDLEHLRDRLDQEAARIDKRIEELSSGVKPASKRTLSLWDDTVDVTGGSVEVFDKAGKKIATLKIKGPDLERWLLDADVERVEPAKPANETSSKPEPSPAGAGKN